MRGSGPLHWRVMQQAIRWSNYSHMLKPVGGAGLAAANGVYTHVMNRPSVAVQSPLDGLRGVG